MIRSAHSSPSGSAGPFSLSLWQSMHNASPPSSCLRQARRSRTPCPARLPFSNASGLSEKDLHHARGAVEAQLEYAAPLVAREEPLRPRSSSFAEPHLPAKAGPRGHDLPAAQVEPRFGCRLDRLDAVVRVELSRLAVENVSEVGQMPLGIARARVAPPGGRARALNRPAPM